MKPTDIQRFFQPVDKATLYANNTLNKFISEIAEHVGVTEFNVKGLAAICNGKVKFINKVSIGAGKKALFKLKGVKDAVPIEEISFNHIEFAKELMLTSLDETTKSNPSIVE